MDFVIVSGVFQRAPETLVKQCKRNKRNSAETPVQHAETARNSEFKAQRNSETRPYRERRNVSPSLSRAAQYSALSA